MTIASPPHRLPCLSRAWDIPSDQSGHSRVNLESVEGPEAIAMTFLPSTRHLSFPSKLAHDLLDCPQQILGSVGVTCYKREDASIFFATTVLQMQYCTVLRRVCSIEFRIHRHFRREIYAYHCETAQRNASDLSMDPYMASPGAKGGSQSPLEPICGTSMGRQQSKVA